MKIAAIIGLWLACAASVAWGQAMLPAFYSGPWSSVPLPTGWTKVGLGSDYAGNYDGIDGGAAKFDSSGDFILIHLASAPGTVKYFTQGNSLSGDYVFKVQQGATSNSLTDVVVYNSGNPISGSVVGRTNNLLATTRFVKFIYVTKALGNVGVDGIGIEGPGAPTVGFTPSGDQSVPVSNQLSLAVAIAPSGSGLQGWSLTPAYSGAANLAGGTFTFTPASGDNGKTFTLAVVATNSVGTTTGTVSIAVTAYEPPVPVISFSPTNVFTIMATSTQKVGIGVSPAGSGIHSWTLLPSNYAGSATLVGTNFTFTTAQADGPASYVLTVVASNSFGHSTGTVDFTVTTYVPPPLPGSIFVDFEDAPSKTAYAPATNTLSGRSWWVGGVIGTLEGDKKFDLKALRIRCNATDHDVKLMTLFPLTNGIGEVSLWFASYGNDGTNNMPQVSVEISTNMNSGWLTLDTFDTGSATTLVYRTIPVNVRETVYLRLKAPQAGNDKRANVDNLTITAYAPPTGYEAYLLQYNVTPGDAGTAPGEDWDGDGASNSNEFMALPQTNPYDPASAP